MASPQVENGYTKIANELLDALIRHPGLETTARTLLWIIRQTYGWGQKEFKIETYRLRDETGLGHRQARRALKKLRDLNMIHDGGIQKDYDLWIGQKCPIGQKRPRTNMSEKWDKSVLLHPIIKKRKKERSNDLKGFDIFWETYPRKIGKGAAARSWKRIKPDDALLQKILTAIENQKKTVLGVEKTFVPYPATWLNALRWEDEIERPVLDISNYPVCPKCRFHHRNVKGVIVAECDPEDLEFRG